MATANLWINPRENAVYDLPRVCMKCGAPATTVRKKQFSWYPPWVTILIFFGVWPFLIAAMILTKRQSVEAPFCDQHKNHWLIRILAGVLIFFVLLGIGFVGLIFTTALGANWGHENLFGFVFLGWFAALFFCVFGMAIFNGLTMIRVTKITDREIALANVSPEFVRVLKEEEEEYERNLDRGAGDRWSDRSRRAHRPDDNRIERRNDRPPRTPSTDIREGDKE